MLCWLLLPASESILTDAGPLSQQKSRCDASSKSPNRNTSRVQHRSSDSNLKNVSIVIVVKNVTHVRLTTMGIEQQKKRKRIVAAYAK